MDKIIRALSLWREKYENSSMEEKFHLLSYLYLDSEYVWGREGLSQSDCSGLVCGILTFLGYPIRITATGLMNTVFKKETNSDYVKGLIKAVFYVADEDYDTPSGTRPKGTARHVALLESEDLLIHSSYPRGTGFSTMDDLQKHYLAKGASPVWRVLDWEALANYEGEVYGLDEELI